MARDRQTGFPWRMMTALIVGCVAVVALTSLRLLRTLSEHATRRIAATSFLETGKSLSAALARTCLSDIAVDDAELWRRLGWYFDTVASADPTLESLSVEHNGLTVFRHQASLGALVGLEHTAVSAEEREAVVAEHMIHDVAGQSLPVVVFTRRIGDGAGGEYALQLGLRREALAQDELLAQEAVRSMYWVAVTTQSLALAALLGLVLWLSSRERGRETRRREEEHLAYAGVMANGIVHDFRNPMSSIRLDAQMLEREALKPEARPARMADLAGRMRTTLDRIESVFQEFFFLSQPSRAVLEDLDILACLRECAGILQARFEAAGVGVVFAPDGEGGRVKAHAAPLRRALLNVLSNAVAFSPRGADVELRVSRRRTEVVIDILDRGPGIPPEDRSRVFEMFVSTRPGGTGLGLFLARTALAGSGGKIEALEREGGGSCMRVRLPASDSRQTRDSAAQAGKVST